MNVKKSRTIGDCCGEVELNMGNWLLFLCWVSPIGDGFQLDLGAPLRGVLVCTSMTNVCLRQLIDWIPVFTGMTVEGDVC